MFYLFHPLLLFYLLSDIVIFIPASYSFIPVRFIKI